MNLADAIPFWVTPLVIATVFAITFVGETIAPLRRRVEPRLRRVARNLAAGGVSLALMSVLQAPLLLPVAGWVAEREWGLLGLFRAHPLLETILAVILLDYTLFWWHRANHRVPFLWRFHLVHHVDRDLDASTALRFHFGEMTLSIPVRGAQIALIGADIAAVAIWQAILFGSILFHHSNLRLPRRLESLLVLLIVTPRMHGIHHSMKEEETNSNWSSMLTLWDLLHRTFRFDVPDERIVIGVPAHDDPEDVTLGRILTLPFRRQRDDWSPRPPGSS